MPLRVGELPLLIHDDVGPDLFGFGQALGTECPTPELLDRSSARHVWCRMLRRLRLVAGALDGPFERDLPFGNWSQRVSDPPDDKFCN